MENGQRFPAQKFPALYVRDFRLFWLGQIISLSGTWMHSVAQSWLVYSLTKSPLYLGIVASLSSLPILLFTLFGGMVADRYPKRNILIITQIMSIIPALTVAILADKNIISVWHVGIIATFLGTVKGQNLGSGLAISLFVSFLYLLYSPADCSTLWFFFISLIRVCLRAVCFVTMHAGFVLK